MRRKDREITDEKQIQDIMERCDCCRLGLYDGTEVYIVPMNFGYVYDGTSYTLYFHGAKEGRRGTLVQGHTPATFEMDTNYQLNKGDTACQYSARFQSIMGTGTLTRITDIPEKKQALNQIMKHTTGKDGWEFAEPMLRTVDVLQLAVTTLSCKEHP